MKRQVYFKLVFGLTAVFTLLNVALTKSDKIYAQTGFDVVVSQVDSSLFPLIVANTTVSDQNGLPILDLSQNSFEVVEDGIVISTISVTPTQSTSEPLALAIALDLSGSMQGPPLSNTVAAILSLVNGLSPADEVALIAFSDKAVVAIPLTTDKTQISAALGTLIAKGNTALWDGVHESVTTLSLHPTGRRAVIVVTDGQDTSSLLKLDDVTSEATGQHLPIFPVGFGAVDEAALERLAELTGGEAFVSPESDQLQTQFNNILDRLRQQYVVSFDSNSLADGAEHRFVVRVKHLGSQAEGTGSFVPPPIELSVSLANLTDDQQFGIGIPTRFTPQFPRLASVTSVDYFLDGTRLTTVTEPPFEYSWTPIQADIGSHTLTARVTDAVGATAESTVSIEVVPAVTLVITSPKAGDVISGAITLQAEVTALSTISAVDFLIDGKSVGVATSAPYTVEWNSATVPAGDHELTVVVLDTTGQSVEDSLSFHVQVGINSGLIIAIVLVLISIGVIVPLSLRSRRGRLVSVKPEPTAAKPPGGAGIAASVPEAQLILEAGEGQGKSWPVGMREVRIGRQRSENDIILSGRAISRHHAAIRVLDGKYVYFNLSQTGDSVINGQPINSQRPLMDGDRIEIGDFVFRFVISKPAKNA